MTDKNVWASNADPVGELAIKLASTANDLEDEQGEWTWRDIAAAALRTQRNEVAAEAFALIERLAQEPPGGEVWQRSERFAAYAAEAAAIRNLKSQEERG